MLYKLTNHRYSEILGFNAIETDHLPTGVSAFTVIDMTRRCIEHAQDEMKQWLMSHGLTVENNIVVRKNILPKSGEDFTAVNSLNEMTHWTVIRWHENKCILYPRNNTLTRYADELEMLKKNNPYSPII